jgi:hypothetical protein
MQLPRGTKRYIKKGTKLEDILEDLQLSKFTGICTISRGPLNGSIVYKSGKLILAEFQSFVGDTAWDELQKIAGENVDVAVSTMDDTQIELSLEFNKSARTGRKQIEKVKKVSGELPSETIYMIVSEKGSEIKKIAEQNFGLNSKSLQIPLADSPKKSSILTHQFKIALSFSGKHRDLVEKIADDLTKHFGKNLVFYDNYFKGHLAQPNLDLLLQRIFIENSELNVVFLSSDYEDKDWCGLEFRAIRDLIKKGHSDKIMLLKINDIDIQGLFSIDGYIDIREMTHEKVIECIINRAKGFD